MTLGPIRLWQRGPDGSVDTTATLKVLCIYMTIAVMIALSVGATVSLVYQWTHDGKSLDPSEAWRDILKIVLTFIAVTTGVAGGIAWAKWHEAPKTAAADAVRETTKAKIATGEFAVPAVAPLADAVIPSERPTPLPPESREDISADEIP